jgi:Secretion system C-terminal sorting domain/Beta-propeller repeat
MAIGPIAIVPSQIYKKLPPIFKIKLNFSLPLIHTKMKNMKRLIYSILALLFTMESFSQTPNWNWSKNIGGFNKDEVNAVTTDNSGNIYMTGKFVQDTLIFGNDTLISKGYDDFFISKFDAAGNSLWAKSAGGHNIDGGVSVATDVNGNVYATGTFYNDSIVFGNDTLISSTPNFFVVKYDSLGNLLWVRSPRLINNANATICKIKTDNNSNVYITGGCWGAFVLGNDTINLSMPRAVFVIKYDSSGNLIWSESAGITFGDVKGKGVDIDGNYNVYVCGYFSGNSLLFPNDTLTQSGNTDMFLVKYDSSGNELWARKQDNGGVNIDQANTVAVDNYNNVYIAGYFYSPSLQFSTYTLLNTGIYDIFIVKYDSIGNVIWAKSAGSANQTNTGDMATSIVMDKNNNKFYMTGFFGGPNITFGNDNLLGNGFYIVKYDTAGVALWAKAADYYDGFSNGMSIAIDLTENVYVAGNYDGTFITFGSNTLNNIGNQDIFLAKIGNTTGIIENTFITNQVSLYPNPFTTILNVQLKENADAEIILYDLAARKMLHQKITNSILLNTEQLANGLYIYEIRFKNGNYIKGKVVKN